MDYLCCLLKPSGVGHWQRIIGNNCWFSTCPCNPSYVIMPLVLCVLLQSCYGNAFSCVCMCVCIPKLLSPQSPLPRVALEQIHFRSSCHRTCIPRENWPLLIKSVSHPLLVQRCNHLSQRSVRRQTEFQFQLEGVSGGSEGRGISGGGEPQLAHLPRFCRTCIFSEDVCLEGCKYSKLYLLITKVVLVLSPNLPCLAAPTYSLYNHSFIS